MSARKKRYSVTLAPVYVEALEQLVEDGVYSEPQEAIREVLRRLFRYHRLPPFYPEAEA